MSRCSCQQSVNEKKTKQKKKQEGSESQDIKQTTNFDQKIHNLISLHRIRLQDPAFNLIKNTITQTCIIQFIISTYSKIYRSSLHNPTYWSFINSHLVQKGFSLFILSAPAVELSSLQMCEASGQWWRRLLAFPFIITKVPFTHNWYFV